MPRVQNPSIGAGASALLENVVTLTSAQILAMPGTVPIVLPAPGAGKVNVVLGAEFVYSAGTRLYLPTAGDQLNHVYTPVGTLALTQGANNVLSAARSAVAFTGGNMTGAELILAGVDNEAVGLLSQAAYTNGPIVTATLGAGGAGYAVNDTGTIQDGDDTATYKVLTVGAGGAVLTFQVTAAGTSYNVENAIPTVNGGAQPGVGVGFTINVTAVNPGNGTLKVVTYYQIIPVP